MLQFRNSYTGLSTARNRYSYTVVCKIPQLNQGRRYTNSAETGNPGRMNIERAY